MGVRAPSAGLTPVERAVCNALGVGEEAFLAAIFIFTVHFFNTHFRPSKFPIDTVIFTGRFPKYEMIEERTEQYYRLLAEKKLETYRGKYPSVAADLFSMIMGFSMLAIGLLCVFLIAWEFLL